MIYVEHLNPFWQSLFCKLWLLNVLHVFLYCVSGYNLVALSIERYQAIVKPFEYDEVKVRETSATLCIW